MASRIYPPNSSRPPRIFEASSSLACSECVVDCNDTTCTAEIDDRCTDQCVIVPCDIPEHGDDDCPQGSCKSACAVPDSCLLPGYHPLAFCETFPQNAIFCVPDSCMEACERLCDDAANCSLVNVTERVPPHGSQFMPGTASTSHTHLRDWDAEINALLCCRGVEFSPQDGHTTQHFFQEHYLRPASVLSTLPSPTETNSLPSGFDSPIPLPIYTPLYLAQSPAPVIPLGHTCLWNGCGTNFSSRAELISHVNASHLRASPSQFSEPVAGPSSYLPINSDASGVSCQWDNCHEYASIPVNSSSGLGFDALNSLTGHVLHDHLGLQGWQDDHGVAAANHAPVPDVALPLQIPNPGQEVEMRGEECRSDNQQQGIPLVGGAKRDGVNKWDDKEQSSTTTHDDKAPTLSANAAERCRWRGCELSFTSVDDLMNHLTTEHVGSGKNRYECFWVECDRSGENGFNSKQKVCRHLQMHTGYKPFRCERCQQHFSEAATLQQHMRRHTQQRPYRCDFPGCEKAFAIAGALTIHRRTHTGLKPFKCPYCERAFSESSNLSKHMRTHTGARPYMCEVPGCGKSFARPDQRTRHQRVHSKRNLSASPGDNG